MCAPNGLSTSFYATRIKKEKWLGNELEKKVKSGGWLFCRIFSCDTANIGESPTNGPWIGTRYLHTSPTTSPPSTGILRANIECATDWLTVEDENKKGKHNSSARKRRRWIFELGDSHFMWKEISPVAPLSSLNNSDFWDYRGSREFCLRRRRRNRTWQL